MSSLAALVSLLCDRHHALFCFHGLNGVSRSACHPSANGLTLIFDKARFGHSSQKITTAVPVLWHIRKLPSKLPSHQVGSQCTDAFSFLRNACSRRGSICTRSKTCLHSVFPGSVHMQWLCDRMSICDAHSSNASIDFVLQQLRCTWAEMHSV